MSKINTDHLELGITLESDYDVAIGDLPVFAFYGPNRNFQSQKRKDIWTTNQRINTYLNALEEGKNN